MNAVALPQKNALVTGGTGFIGSHLVRRLVREGWKVDLVTPPDTPLAALQDTASRVGVHVLDGSTEQLCSIVASCQPDIVFHLASLFLASHDVSQVEPLVRSNVLFGTQVAEAMVKSGVLRVVNTGTSWQHFEGRDYSPVCLYAATKQAFEDVLAYYVEACGLRLVTLKLFDTYGPDDARPKLMPALRRAAQSGTRLQMSPGEQLVDFVYIDDVIEAFFVAARRLFGNDLQEAECYGVSSGHPMRLRDVVETYERVTGKKIMVEWGTRPYRPREVMVPWTSSPIPGWQPRVELEEGIKRIESMDAAQARSGSGS
jgi:nucleoside-diphosphate-sugar epimerase